MKAGDTCPICGWTLIEAPRSIVVVRDKEGKECMEPTGTYLSCPCVEFPNRDMTRTTKGPQ